jgi:hypothetical protein
MERVSAASAEGLKRPGRSWAAVGAERDDRAEDDDVGPGAR